MSDHPILTIIDVAAPDAYPAITAATESAEWPALTERLERTAEDYRRAPSLHALVQLEGTLHAILRARRDTLDAWTDAEPDNGWAWLMLGMADTYAGLDARGEETADMLTDAEWDQVATHMNRAQEPLARGEQAEARAVLIDVPADFAACKYALARGLDEGWFGAADPLAALKVSSSVLPQVFDPYLSVLHMTLLSAQGHWDAAREHGGWLLEEVAAGQLELPEPLINEVQRLMGEIPKPGLGGLLKRTFSNTRLRMEVESPELWAT